MNIKKIIMGFLASTIISTATYAAELRDSFRGFNGGVRVIDSVVTEGDTTTFTITTTNSRGRVKTKEFTATMNGDTFDISGNGRDAFKDWLRLHAAQHQNIVLDSGMTDNEIAFNAWKQVRIENARATNSIWLETFENYEYLPENDWVQLTENQGIEVEYETTPFSGFNFTLGTPDYSNPIDAHVENIERDTGDVTEIVRVPGQRRMQLINNVWVDTATILNGKDAIYHKANVRGLKEAHDAGWTGKGVTIGIGDSSGLRSHGHYVADAALVVAPGATIPNYDTKQFYRGFSNVDIINRSSGSYLSVNGRLTGNGTTTIESLAHHAATYANLDEANNPGALHVTTHPNITRCNYQGHNAANCSGKIAAHNMGLLNGEYIFVRAEGPSYNSHAAGDSDIKNHTLSADGKSPSRYSGGGTSYAAPKVSGAAALVMHKFPELNASQVKTVLLESAHRDFDHYDINVHGKGILDVGAALSPLGTIN